MEYIQVIELKNTSDTICLLKILNRDETIILNKLKEHDMKHCKRPDDIEVETSGIKLINIMSAVGFAYKICGQSMVIEETNIGGRTIRTQKICWTLGKEAV